MAPPGPDKMSAEDRRDAIVTASLPLFAAHGVDGVTTKAIAKAAGVSEALIYRHFKSKNELFGAIQGNCLGMSANRARAFQSLPDSTFTFIACIYVMVTKTIGYRVDKTVGQAEIHRLVVRSLLSDGAFAKDHTCRISAPWLDKTERCWAAAKAEGALISNASHSDFTMWFAYMLSVAISMYNLPTEEVVAFPDRDETFANEAVLFALRGMGLTEAAIARYYDRTRLQQLADGELPSPKSA